MKPMPSQYFTADNCPLQVGSVIHDYDHNRDLMVIAKELNSDDKYFICVAGENAVIWLSGEYLANNNCTYYPNWPDTSDEKPCCHEPNSDELKVQFVNKLFELVKQLPGTDKLHNGPVWDDDIHTAIQEGAIDMLTAIEEALNENN